MKILARHVTLSLLKGYLPVLIVLLSILSLFVLVDEVDEVGKGQYTFPKAAEFLWLTMPSRVVFLAPYVALLGSIMALGELANGRELLAMQASGISPYQIAGAVMKFGLVFILGIAGLEQFVTPPLDQQAHFARSLALADSRGYQSKQGFWFKEGPQYIRIRKVLYGEIPQGIDIFEFNTQGQLSAYLHAQEAQRESPTKWLLQQVEKTVVRGQTVFQDYVDRMAWESPLKPEDMRLLTLPMSSLSPVDLYQYVRFLERKGRNSIRYELTFWEKIFRPLNVSLMILVGIPFVFGPLRTATMGKRVLMGTLAGLGYYFTTQIFQQVGISLGFAPVVTILVPFGLLLGGTILFWYHNL